ncbi:HAMP domain-containing histidine kinase [Massilia sp. IC2-477]|uniref:sensor histidine kinase n=1 Tax=Massilia sp. IC2-477 TaxID=2887198 RepID=UPI001D1073DB|nr:HAMP domain-containing sensor histidine kinase [Massilia sp. IC2-477]MCC2954804.1 HAMP domain-containing histidine kinase [Massilia sp. IC2-477]
MARSTPAVPPAPHSPEQSSPGAAGLDAHFRTIAELGGDIPFSIDLPARTLRYLSPAFTALLGHDAGALQAAIAGGGVRQALGALGMHLAQSGDGQPGERHVQEVDARNADGHPIGLEVITTVVRNSDGSSSLVGLLRDLSPQRAHLADQRRFASMLNHEFRTPLATIDGAIQRLEATSHGADDAVRQRYRKIATAVDRLIEMLDEYLSPDRMAAIGKVRQPNTIAARELLEAGVQQVRAAGRDARVETEDMELGLRGEPEGLRLALKVLVDNALLFSPAGSGVALSARRSGSGVEFTVRDEGAGVPPQDAERIFDKGYRGSNAAGLPGNGLGLYMARSIVDVHGGMLRLGNAGEGEGGAEFRLWLPALHISGQQQLASSSSNSDNRNDH